MSPEYRSQKTFKAAGWEKNGGLWPIRSRELDKLSNQFQPVLGNFTIEAFLRSRVEYADLGFLDVMGFGNVVHEARERDILFSWGGSISLEHHISPKDRTIVFQQQRIAHFIGDVATADLWERIGLFREQHRLPLCGLVLCAPAGAFYSGYFPVDIGVFNFFLQQIWGVTSVKNGTVLMEVPRWLTTDYKKSFDAWVGLMQLQRKPGTTQSYLTFGNNGSGLVMKLEKTPLIHELPRLQE